MILQLLLPVFRPQRCTPVSPYWCVRWTRAIQGVPCYCALLILHLVCVCLHSLTCKVCPMLACFYCPACSDLCSSCVYVCAHRCRLLGMPQRLRSCSSYPVGRSLWLPWHSSLPFKSVTQLRFTCLTRLTKPWTITTDTQSQVAGVCVYVCVWSADNKLTLTCVARCRINV